MIFLFFLFFIFYFFVSRFHSKCREIILRLNLDYTFDPQRLKLQELIYKTDQNRIKNRQKFINGRSNLELSSTYLCRNSPKCNI